MQFRALFALFVPLAFSDERSSVPIEPPTTTQSTVRDSAFRDVGFHESKLRDSTLRLPKLFGDGMVMQRDAAIPVFGWARAGQRVSVTLDGKVQAVTTNANGEWRVSYAAKPAGGPFELKVDADDAHVLIHNVLVGDVWIASGQSNMEWTLIDAKNGPAEVASANDAKLRQFKVPNTWSWKPENDLAGGSWAVADPQHAGAFTAVGYFFARELRKHVDVPIGIINNAWSGASIEPYMSRAALAMDADAVNAIKSKEESFKSGIRETLRAKLGSLPTVDSGMVNGRALWADSSFNDATWQSFNVPGSWERAGYAGMDGVVWFRTSVTLTADDIKQRVQLGVGVIDDADVTFVNGVKVGGMNSYGTPRVYDVPASALRAGRNVITVQVTDGGGDGGILGSPQQVYLDVGGAKRSLAGAWKFRVAKVSLSDDGQHINKIPTILYNQMVHPLLPFPIKGVIWYQGESNSNNDAQAMAYRAQFATMIKAWRSEWKSTRGTFPFLWVQLPNYGAIDSNPPTHAGWALLRESQNAALALPNTAQAVAIDIGEAAVLHPTNKQDVGARLALAARAIAYNQSVVYQGPSYKSHVVRNGRMVIEFEHVASGLANHAQADTISGFAIAGADQKFVWATARLEGNHVVVFSDKVSQPVAVRYAWSNSPRSASLYNKDGLPAVPFRTDNW